MEYPRWDPSQAGVEDVTAYIEEHGISGRGKGTLVWGAVKGMG